MKYNKKQHTKLSCRSKCFFLALALAMASVDATAQKISLGSCITRDGGQFKGEMVINASFRIPDTPLESIALGVICRE